MVFYHGPPLSVPEGENHCESSSGGRVASASKYALHLSTSLPGSLFILICAGVLGVSIFSLTPKDDELMRILKTVLGILVGSAIGLSALVGICLIPLSRRCHWRIRLGRFEDDSSLGIWLISRHWHMVRHPQLEISGKGHRWVCSGLADPKGFPSFAARPGDSVGSVQLTSAIPDPIPPGNYRLRWFMESKHGGGTVTLIKGRAQLP
jgi:hypothetical protein